MPRHGRFYEFLWSFMPRRQVERLFGWLQVTDVNREYALANEIERVRRVLDPDRKFLDLEDAARNRMQVVIGLIRGPWR